MTSDIPEGVNGRKGSQKIRFFPMQDMYPLIIPKGFPEGLEEKGIVTS